MQQYGFWKFRICVVFKIGTRCDVKHIGNAFGNVRDTQAHIRDAVVRSARSRQKKHKTREDHHEQFAQIIVP